jgi:hypothetical protein
MDALYNKSQQILLYSQQFIHQLEPDNVKKQQTKLSLVYSEVSKQLHVIKRLLLSLKSKSDNLLKEIHVTRMNWEACLSSLGTTLHTLQQKPLHEIFRRQKSINENAVNSIHEKRTLFDFVNIESVNELQRRANAEIEEISRTENAAVSIVKQVEQQLLDLNTSIQNMIHYVNISQIDDFNELNIILKQLKEQELKQLEILAQQIALEFDQYKHMNYSSNFELDAAEQKVAKMDQILEIMKSKCLTFQKQSVAFSEFYDFAVNCYERLERIIAPSIPAKSVQIDQLKTSYYSCQTNNEQLFEEITNLTIWYNYFITSYYALLLEIDRRNRVNKEQMILLEQMRQKLNDQALTEEYARNNFFAEYGKYLPASLCPTIMEPCTKFSILPERIVSNLPKLELSPHEIQELKKQIAKQASIPSNEELISQRESTEEKVDSIHDVSHNNQE